MTQTIANNDDLNYSYQIVSKTRMTCQLYLQNIFFRILLMNENPKWNSLFLKIYQKEVFLQGLHNWLLLNAYGANTLCNFFSKTSNYTIPFHNWEFSHLNCTIHIIETSTTQCMCVKIHKINIHNFTFSISWNLLSSIL